MSAGVAYLRGSGFQKMTGVLRSPLRTWPPRAAHCLYVTHQGLVYAWRPRRNTLTPLYSFPDTRFLGREDDHGCRQGTTPWSSMPRIRSVMISYTLSDMVGFLSRVPIV